MPIKENTKKRNASLLFGERNNCQFSGDFISCEKQFG